DAVPRQQAVALQFLEEDPVRHHLDDSLIVRLVFEAHRVAHDLRDDRVDLPGYELGHRHRGNAARLGYPDHALRGVAGLVEDQGNLRRLARAGGAFHDDDLVALQRSQYFLALLVDRQPVGVHAGTSSLVRVIAGAVHYSP